MSIVITILYSISIVLKRTRGSFSFLQLKEKQEQQDLKYDLKSDKLQTFKEIPQWGPRLYTEKSAALLSNKPADDSPILK